MRFVDVVAVLDTLEATSVRHWVAGGWGVAALVGGQTRSHRDVDLAVDSEDLDACLEALRTLGYQVETNELPVRVEVVAPGRRWVDIHPVRFDSSGYGVQGDPNGIYFDYPTSAWASGTVGGRMIPCLSVAQQRQFHRGYDLRAQDQHDLLLLAAAARAHALAAGDATELTSLLHPEFAWTTHTGSRFDRDEYVRRNTDGTVRWSGQALSNPRVAIVGGTATLICDVLDRVGAVTGIQERRMPVTMCWVWVGQEWICLAGHAGPPSTD